MKIHELAMQLRRAYLSMHRMTNAVIVEDGITADQFVLISVIANATEPLTQREIVDSTFSDPNTVRAMLLLLEKRGLVARKVSEQDGRAWKVSLTAAGKKLWPRLWKSSQLVRTQMSELIGKDEIQELTTTLEKLASGLNDPKMSATPKRLR